MAKKWIITNKQKQKKFIIFMLINQKILKAKQQALKKATNIIKKNY